MNLPNIKKRSPSKKKEEVKQIPKLKSKEKKEVLPRQYNQRAYNRLFVGGLVGFILLSGGAMATNIIRVNAKPQTVEVAKEEKEEQSVNYRLQNWSNSFAYYYFNFSSDTQEQMRQLDRLESFYASPLEIKNNSHVRQPSKLNSIKLMEVTDSEVVYLVSYTTNPDTKEKVDTVTEFHIPYRVKNNKFYVSDLPYYSTPEDDQLKELENKEVIRLIPSLNVPTEQQEKLDEFLKLFFTNYTTSQENLNLVSKDVKILSGNEFKTLDFTSYVIDDKQVKATVQVTFMSADKNTRSENFTLELKEKGSSYEVVKMTHGIK